MKQFLKRILCGSVVVAIAVVIEFLMIYGVANYPVISIISLVCLLTYFIGLPFVG